MRDDREYNLDIGMSGTSCSLVIMIGNNVYYGFVGDSLICLSKVLSGNQNINCLNNEFILNNG